MPTVTESASETNFVPHLLVIPGGLRTNQSRQAKFTHTYSSDVILHYITIRRDPEPNAPDRAGRDRPGRGYWVHLWLGLDGDGCSCRLQATRLRLRTSHVRTVRSYMAMDGPRWWLHKSTLTVSCYANEIWPYDPKYDHIILSWLFRLNKIHEFSKEGVDLCQIDWSWLVSSRS